MIEIMNANLQKQIEAVEAQLEAIRRQMTVMKGMCEFILEVSPSERIMPEKSNRLQPAREHAKPSIKP